MLPAINISLNRMKANDFYALATKNGIHLHADCVSSKIDRFLRGAKKADQKRVEKLIKDNLPDLYVELRLDLHNPWGYDTQRNDEYIIYVHSAVHYIFKINDV